MSVSVFVGSTKKMCSFHSNDCKQGYFSADEEGRIFVL